MFSCKVCQIFKNTCFYRILPMAAFVLSYFQNMLGVAIKINRKKICKIFQQHGLKMTTETNSQVTDSFNSMFNINNGKCNHL